MSRGTARPASARTCGAILGLLLAAAAGPVAAAASEARAAGTAEAAELLARLLRVDTTNPPGRERAAAEILRAFFDGERIPSQVYESEPGRANLVARLPATAPTPGGAEPLLLLSHLDVVPADPEAWTFPPFSGARRGGAVVGRGALDDKGQAAIFAVALARLARDAAPRTRDLVYCATADEEVDGSRGAVWMIEHHWDALGPPAVVWNEGGASIHTAWPPGQIVNGIATTEKRALWIRLVAEGEGGHGSQPLPDGAVERLVGALGRLAAFETELRVTPTVAEQFRRVAARLEQPERFLVAHLDHPLVLALASGRLTEDRMLNAMVRDTVAWTGLRAGLKHNVIPRRAEADLDVRLLPDTDAADFLEQLAAVIADPHVRIDTDGAPLPPVVAASPYGHPLFRAIEEAMARELPESVSVPIQSTGGTDSSWFRERGVPAYGYLPVLLTPELNASIHGADERLPLAELERALRVTRRVLERWVRP